MKKKLALGGLVLIVAAGFLTYRLLHRPAAGNGALTLYGNVTFNHKMHSEKFACKTCHEGTPGKFELNMATAHKLCKDCHKEKGVPTKCSTCHKK